MPILFYADLHAQAHTWVGRPEMRGDAACALDQIARKAEVYGADVIDGGDTYHIPRPDGDVVTLVQGMIHRVLNTGHRFGFVYGNHSAFPLATSPELLKQVIHLGEIGMNIGDHHVIGFDHMSRTRVQETLPNISLDADVVVCHWKFRDAFGWGSHQLTLDDTPEHVKLWLAGDIHHKFELENKRGQTLVYPGSPYITRLDDTEENGIWLIDDDLGLTHDLLVRRPILREKIETHDDLERVIAAARHKQKAAVNDLPEPWSETVSQPIVVLTWYIDDLPGAGKTVAEALEGEAHVFEDPMDHESEAVIADMRDSGTLSQSQLSLPAFLPQELDQEKSPIVFDALTQFLGGSTIQRSMRAAGIAHGLSEAELDTLIPSSREGK